MHSLKSIFPVLAAILLLAALAACSVESREEREQRLSGQEVTQESPQEATQESADDSTGVEPVPVAEDEPAAEDGQETPGPATGPATDPATTLQEEPEDQNGSRPAGGLHGTALDLGSDAVLTPDGVAFSDPAEVVRAFFRLALARDMEGLRNVVTRDQRELLPKLLQEIDAAMAQPGGEQLLGIDQVDVLQTTRTAVVDVNVTLRFAGEVKMEAESVELKYEDGAWRIADIDF